MGVWCKNATAALAQTGLTALDCTGPGSASAWVRLSRPNAISGAGGYIFEHITESTSRAGIRLALTTAAIRLQTANGANVSNHDFSGAGSLLYQSCESRFIHVVCTWDNTNVLCYLDGRLVGTIAQGRTPTAAGTRDTRIGQNTGASAIVHYISDVQYWAARALAPAEAGFLYRLGCGGPPSLAPTARYVVGASGHRDLVGANHLATFTPTANCDYAGDPPRWRRPLRRRAVYRPAAAGDLLLTPTGVEGSGEVGTPTLLVDYAPSGLEGTGELTDPTLATGGLYAPVPFVQATRSAIHRASRW